MFEETFRMQPLDSSQNQEEMERKILELFKENKVSLSQARYLFVHILERIEDDNLIDM